jgi:hypothetical protein
MEEGQCEGDGGGGVDEVAGEEDLGDGTAGLPGGEIEFQGKLL